MLVAILLWLYIFILFYLYGCAFLFLLRRILKLDPAETTEPPIIIFLGLMVVTVLAMFGNLFVPLGAAFVLILSIGAIIIAFHLRPSFPFSFPEGRSWVWIIFILMFVTVLENATHIPLNDDTGLYHAQTIRWFESYRIVPGLGNLQIRYALNSSWLVLNSAFSFVFLGLRSFRLLNGVIFITAIYYFTGGLQALVKGQASSSSLMKVVFLPLSFYLLGSEISSVGTDMPVTLMIWIVLLIWVEKIETLSESRLKSIILFLLCFLAVTVKLSSLPLLLFAMFVLVDYLRERNWRSMFVLTALGSLIFLPWMIRSVFLSGYLVFPQLQIDLFPVDWKIPREQVDLIIQAIAGLARIGNSWRPSMDVSFWEWAPGWFDRLTLNRQATLVLALISPLIILAGRYKYPSVVSNKYILSFFTMFTGSILWFVSAPDIRFGYGFLVVTCMLALVPFGISFVRLKKISNYVPRLTLLLLFVFQSYVFLNSFDSPTFAQRWLLPADYLPSSAQPCGFDGMEIYCRKTGDRWNQCYYDLFPCIPSHFPEVEMRGLTFQDGFKPVVVDEP